MDFNVDEIFTVKFDGIKLEDDFISGFRKNEVRKGIQMFSEAENSNFGSKEAIGEKNNSSPNNIFTQNDNFFSEKKIQKVTFHPFDDRYIFQKNFVDSENANFFNAPENNIFLVFSKSGSQSFWISKYPVANDLISSSTDCSVFPLYLYPENSPSLQDHTRVPNLNPQIINQISTALGLSFTPEKEKTSEGEVCFLNSAEVRPEFRFTFAALDILDYIYAMIQTSDYEKMKLIRNPDPATFWKLVEYGAELRQVHLLECSAVNHFITRYPVAGDHLVTDLKYENEKVFINKAQYFDKVSPSIWNSFIGEYRPAQQWLNDRKGRKLDFDDIHHYQKIIVALSETARIRKKLEELV